MARKLILLPGKRSIALTIVAVASLALAASPLAAADLPTKAPRAQSIVYDWTGFYVGGHVGYGAGSFGPGTNAVLNYGVALPASLTGLTAGFQSGYRYQFANHVVLGAEGEVTFPDAVDLTKISPAPFKTTFDVFGSAHLTAGYSIGAWLP